MTPVTEQQICAAVRLLARVAPDADRSTLNMHWQQLQGIAVLLASTGQLLGTAAGSALAEAQNHIQRLEDAQALVSLDRFRELAYRTRDERGVPL